MQLSRVGPTRVQTAFAVAASFCSRRPRGIGAALPLPPAGEGWGEGVSTSGQPPRGKSPHPPRTGRCFASPGACNSRGYASASFGRTAAEGGLCSPASGRGGASRKQSSCPVDQRDRRERPKACAAGRHLPNISR
ncbi:hypothetical protein EAS56_14090 [Bradyrhizobium guangzhouense]|uniref:Uncharacterized protein n=1 Tax=Bradyrhizobium guangzhouense TaxID=1325095 RepID=A0AAE5X1Y1_9BRAD|nr:hypothetical protein XH91_18885 [Bradyrhizobium guangzhouense]RXH13722.1 hypothetical protein EAS56_14090 [Bradyrhizobium guangzhouense]